jgi:hypothetical protein
MVLKHQNRRCALAFTHGLQEIVWLSKRYRNFSFQTLMAWISLRLRNLLPMKVDMVWCFCIMSAC